MKKYLLSFLTIVGVLFLISLVPTEANAQCAMCRATLENNVSNGEVGMAASLNMGILYLFAMPYLVVAFIAYVWYRKSRANAETSSFV